MLCELPNPIQSDGVDTLQREYPSAVFLNRETLFVADGHGSLYALLVGDTGPASLCAPVEVATPPVYGSSQCGVPFRVHSVAPLTEGNAVVVLSAKHTPKPRLRQQMDRNRLMSGSTCGA